MTLRLLGLVLIAGAYLVSLTAIIAVRVATRPRPVQPDPPTMELGPEPPAVVNLLLHRDRVTVAAAEATLLDLAGRHPAGAVERGRHRRQHDRPPPAAGPDRPDRLRGARPPAGHRAGRPGLGTVGLAGVRRRP